MRVTFLVDEYLSERSEGTGFPCLGDAAQELGFNVLRSKYIPFSKNLHIEPKPLTWEQFDYLDCVVTHGTIQFCRQVEKKFGRKWRPCMYFNKNVKSYEMFAIHYGNNMLNDEYYILPLAEIERRQLKDIFIKPLSGLKDFTGQAIYNTDELEFIGKHEILAPELLCVVASIKDVKAEFRYVIVDGKVVTGSEYRWGDKLDIRIDTHPTCDDMANWVAVHEWQPDTVYVCDIALIEHSEGDTVWYTAKIIELNAFSSSGLYACNTYKIVEAVARAAEKEYYGEGMD